MNGAERTTAWPVVQAVAKRMGLTINPDPRPEQGSYYRSDHFSFAHAGIPAFSVEEGDDFIGKPKGFGEKAFDEYNEKHYHQPSDEFQEELGFFGPGRDGALRISDRDRGGEPGTAAELARGR